MFPDKIIGLGIIQVPEDRRIFPDLTIQEKLDMGAYLRNDKEAIKADLDTSLNYFPFSWTGDRKAAEL